MCTVSSKCHAIEDIQIYIDDSLDSKLRPPLNCKLIAESRLIGQEDETQEDESAKPVSPTDNSKHGNKNESDLRRAKRLINLSRSRNVRPSVDEEEGPGDEPGPGDQPSEDKESETQQDKKKLPANDNKTEGENGGVEGVEDKQTDKEEEVENKAAPVQQEPQTKKPFKLSYTTSNIKLKGMFDNSHSSIMQSQSTGSINNLNRDRTIIPSRTPSEGTQASHGVQVRLFSTVSQATASTPSLKSSAFTSDSRHEHSESDLAAARRILQKSVARAKGNTSPKTVETVNMENSTNGKEISTVHRVLKSIPQDAIEFRLLKGSMQLQSVHTFWKRIP